MVRTVHFFGGLSLGMAVAVCTLWIMGLAPLWMIQACAVLGVLIWAAEECLDRNRGAGRRPGGGPGHAVRGASEQL